MSHICIFTFPDMTTFVFFVLAVVVWVEWRCKINIQTLSSAIITKTKPTCQLWSVINQTNLFRKVSVRGSWKLSLRWSFVLLIDLIAMYCNWPDGGGNQQLATRTHSLIVRRIVAHTPLYMSIEHTFIPLYTQLILTHCPSRSHDWALWSMCTSHIIQPNYQFKNRSYSTLKYHYHTTGCCAVHLRRLHEPSNPPKPPTVHRSQSPFLD